MLKKTPFILLIAASLFLIDFLAKMMITSYFEIGQSVPLLHDILQITYVQNTGAGFSLFSGHNSLLIIVYLVALAIIAFSWKSIPEERIPAGLAGLFIGGIVGNLLDRIVFGHVIDFIDFRFWPVFNIADSGITIGVIGFVLYELFNKKKS